MKNDARIPTYEELEKAYGIMIGQDDGYCYCEFGKFIYDAMNGGLSEENFYLAEARRRLSHENWGEWIEEGRYVWSIVANTNEKDELAILRITTIDDGKVSLSNGSSYDLRGFYFEFAPIKFRPYAYNEACKLLGKTIVTHWGNQDEVRELIYCISENKEGDGVIRINGLTLDELVSPLAATIDDKPIGIPIIDEEV